MGTIKEDGGKEIPMSFVSNDTGATKRKILAALATGALIAILGAVAYWVNTHGG